MKVNIKYFGTIADLTSKPEEIIECNNGISVNDMRSLLESRYERLSQMTFQIAVNQNIESGDRTLHENDELALLPPFAGG